MGDVINVLPTDKEEYSETDKKLIEYLFKVNVKHQEPTKNVKFTTVACIVFLLLSLPVIDEIIYNMCNNKYITLLIKSMLFFTIIFILESYIPTF